MSVDRAMSLDVAFAVSSWYLGILSWQVGGRSLDSPDGVLLTVVVMGDENVSREFRFGPRKFFDKTLSITFIQCQGECRHQDGKAFACHMDCLVFTSHTPLTRLLNALAYSFEPSVAAKERRYRRIQSSFVSKLQLGSRKLPDELALLVFRYCVREYAIAAVWHQNPEPKSYPVYVSAGIWASYIELDGARYFASLRNKSSANAELILSIEKAATVDRMYVAEDHLGIRQVCFSMPTGASGLWWRTLSIYDGTELRVNTDVRSPSPYSPHANTSGRVLRYAV
jgi:hypothetical protein